MENTKLAKLGLSTEICGSILTDRMVANDRDQFKTDPKTYAFQVANIDLGDMDLAVVENTDDTMHLALPYYAGLDRPHASAMDDESLTDVSGGEVLIVGLTLIIGIPAVGLIATTVGTVVDNHVQQQRREGKK